MKRHALSAACLTIWAAVAATWFAPGVRAQDAPAAPQEPWAEVMLLGMTHFAGSSGDMFSVEVDDVLAPRRQREIEAVAEALAAWEPTIVAVERRPDRENLQSDYQAYVRGEHELSVNEVQQLGFRIAAMRGLDRVAPIDAAGPGIEVDYDPETNTGMAAIMPELMAFGQPLVDGISQEFADRSIGSFLRWFNAPEQLAQNHAFYHRFMMRIWNEDDPSGALMVADWYGRNLIIVQNILREAQLAADAGETARVLVIIGQGHVPTMQRFIEDSPYLERVDVRDWLPVE